MNPWNDRPPEVSRLLNPAFCGTLLNLTIKSFAEERKSATPFALLYLVLPLVLHGPTREIMPKSKATRFHAWLMEHPEVRLGLAARTRSLMPYTSEALRFLIEHGALMHSGDGGITAGPQQLAGEQRIARQSRSVAECCSKAGLIGRLFAGAGRTARIFMLLQVRP